MNLIVVKIHHRIVVEEEEVKIHHSRGKPRQ